MKSFSSSCDWPFSCLRWARISFSCPILDAALSVTLLFIVTLWHGSRKRRFLILRPDLYFSVLLECPRPGPLSYDA